MCCCWSRCCFSVLFPILSPATGLSSLACMTVPPSASESLAAASGETSVSCCSAPSVDVVVELEVDVLVDVLVLWDLMLAYLQRLDVLGLHRRELFC